jgi:hypothetical protein
VQLAFAANLAVAATFLVSIPVAFIAGPWAFGLWALLGVATSAAMAVQRRRHPGLDLG